MRNFIAWSVLLLVPAAVSAFPFGGLPKEVQQQERSAEAAAGSKPLFYRLGAAPALAGVRQVEVVFEMDDRLLAREVIQVPSGLAAAATLELLATAPDTLGRLYELAEEEGGLLSVTLLTDGLELRRLSFQDLVAYNREIKTATKLDVVPRKSKVVSALDRPAAGAPGRLISTTGKGLSWVLDQGCVNYCDDQFDRCQRAAACGFKDRRCDLCVEQHNTCVNNCWVQVCTDPKNVSESDEYELINVYYLGQECVQDPNLNTCVVDQYQYSYKVSRVRRTEYCNGTSTSQVLYYSYETSYDEVSTQFSCSFATSSSNNFC